MHGPVLLLTQLAAVRGGFAPPTRFGPLCGAARIGTALGHGLFVEGGPGVGGKMKRWF